jgi:hypothetical protein
MGTMEKKFKLIEIFKYLPIFTLLCSCEVNAQIANDDNTVKYQYSVIDTPYGDYYGVIILKKEGKSYKGEMIDEDGIVYELKIQKFDSNQLIFKSKIDGLKSIFRCEILGDSVIGTGIFSGDEFEFKLKGTRVKD